MSRIFRENSLGNSKRHNQRFAKASFVHVHRFSDINSPFAGAAVSLSDSELRESAYEILLAAIRSTGTRPLTYIPQSEKASKTQVLTHSPSLQRSLTSSAASKVKLALGLRSFSIVKNACCKVDDSGSQVNVKKSMTIGELVRRQMRVSEQTDSRIRRALLRIAACQLGRRMESIVLPFELLQQLKSSDFPNEQEYNAWRRRTLKLLEAGLLLHPNLPLDKTDNTSQRLQEFICQGMGRDFDADENSESMQSLRNAVMSLACRSFDGSVSDTCHWADAFPLNMRIYQLLLDGCFDADDGAIVIKAIDEVLDLIKKTWAILGINQTLHNLCFLWVLFQHYVLTGQVEDDLLFAANNLLMEVEKDAKATSDPNDSRILISVLSPICDWAEKRMSTYHEGFNSDNIESMENIVSMALTAAKLLGEDINAPRERIDTYIISSLRIAFSLKLDKINLSKRLSRHQQPVLPALAILAQEVSQLAFEEKAIFSPILRKWYCPAAGVAAATLHSCYRDELTQFISNISELSLDTIQVLVAADKLEKDLVQIAVEDSVESEDGGKSIIQEMQPYEAEALTTDLMKSWIKTRVDRLEEWVDRNVQQETWSPQANKERVAASVVEVLQVIDETLEAFFLLPIPIHTLLLPDLITGLDNCLQNYILKLKSGCGTKSSFIPILPALTRYTSTSKFQIFKKKENSHINQNKKSQVGSMNWEDLHRIPQLCVRINTLHHIRMQLEVLEKRTILQVRKTVSTHGIDFASRELKRFELSAATCLEEIQQLSEATAYKVVFHELSHVFWDRLYVGLVSSARIEPFIQELEQSLEIIASTVHNKVRLRLITDLMKASFEGFLLVLLAGGPSRAFTVQDCEAIEQDFKFLTDLFWSDGDGLPAELIDKFCVKVKGVISLFRLETPTLIEQLKTLAPESQGSAAKSKLPLAPTSGQWSPTEPNTVLRVLCHRRDEIATKFLKKTYNLPKKL